METEDFQCPVYVFTPERWHNGYKPDTEEEFLIKAMHLIRRLPGKGGVK